jgi:hypothetical protein
MIVDIIKRTALIDVHLGPRGQTGLQGNQGQSGLKGDTGNQGQSGTNATPITNITDDGSGNLTIDTAESSYGPFALKGPVGNDGSEGPQGNDGNNATPITSITDDGSGNLTIDTAESSYGPFALKGPAGNDGSNGNDGAQGPQGEPGTTSWNGITDKPATFAPSAHTHSAADIVSGTLDTARLPATITGLTSVTSTTFVGELTGTASGNLASIGGTLTGALINSRNGAASAPVVSLTGTTFTGGTATTTKPTFLVEPTGTTSTGWSTAGTLIGANAATGFTGRLIDCQLAGVSKFSVSSAGVTSSALGFLGASSGATNPAFGSALNTDFGIYFESSRMMIRESTTPIGAFGDLASGIGLIMTGTKAIGWSSTTPDGSYALQLQYAGSNTLQMGINAASGANQTIKACNGTAGSGADLILSGGTGTTTNGNVRFGTHLAWAAEVISGYITIKDESGTLRKIAVIS